MQVWSPRECKPAEKTVHHASWVISEVLPRVYFTLPACLGPKYTLWSASEMAHGEWCGLHPLGDQSGTPFHQKSPKSPKCAQNRGNPPNKSHVATIVFDTFGSKAWPLFGVSFIRSEKFGAKAWPLLGCGYYQGRRYDPQGGKFPPP